MTNRSKTIQIGFITLLLIALTKRAVKPIALTKREKDYIESFMKSPDPSNVQSSKENYDLNYRLKKKFLKLHEDYWELVSFFKTYDKIFQKRTTEQTIETLLKAKSQIASPETLVNTKCVFCKGQDKQMREVNICAECSAGFGI